MILNYPKFTERSVYIKKTVEMKKKPAEINKLCAKCERKCKQSAETILLGCPNFSFKPQQLEINFKYSKKKDHENHHR